MPTAHAAGFHLVRDRLALSDYTNAMSTTEIIEELPKLTEADRRAVRQRLQELADANAEIHLCNEMATEGAMMLDRMEEEDARRSQR